MILKIVCSVINNFETRHIEDWSIANNIAKYGTYTEFMSVGSTAYKLPVYPLFLSVFAYLFPENSLAVIIVVQHLILFVVPIIIIKTLSLFGKEKVGILAAFIFIFSPAYFHYSNVIEVTNVFVPLFLIWIYVYSKIFLGKSTTLYYVFFGISTAVLFLTQVVVIPIVMILFLVLLLFKKIKITGLAIVLFVTAIFYSPWIVRNKMAFDKIILTKTPVWQNIYLSFTSAPNICNDVILIDDEHERYTFHLRKSVNEFEMERIYKEKTLEVLDGKEIIFIKKSLQNALLLWYVPSRYFYDNSLPILFGRKIFTIILNIFTIFFLFYIYKKYRLLFWISLLLFANFTFPYMIGHASNTRFKLDFEWYQYILVALFFLEIKNKEQFLYH
ncbi:MAG: glycosyltransferase family 39 protein [Cruoricaptor ignavus]|nr:glycosyltransferase family 39 protein [Cruoricaptor ignavus]